MNDTSHAGGRARLGIEIAAKSVRAANGQRVDILRDVKLSVAAGEVVAILGPSGCGKTTLLRCIAGLDEDFDGAISRPEPGRLGMVFQEPRLLPWRTVEENIRLAAPEVSAALLDGLLGALHLDQHRRHFPGELSLGLARRVAIARAFAVEPDLLLLDEPFVSLDGPLASELRRELAQLVGSRPVTTLIVTHDAAEAAELADTAYLLSARPASVVARIGIDAPRSGRTASDVIRIGAELRDRLSHSVSRI